MIFDVFSFGWASNIFIPTRKKEKKSNVLDVRKMDTKEMKLFHIRKMSQTFLETTRKEVVAQRNTAQQKISEIIQYQITSTGKEITELLFSDALSGDIDFTNLPVNVKSNLKRLKTIQFTKGEITSIQGWSQFPTLETVEIPNNLLVDIGFPKTQTTVNWKTINLQGNGLTNLEWQRMPKLVTANVSHNQLKKIGGLPETLERLHCEYNELDFLDLSKCSELVYANCSHNHPQLTLIPPPPSSSSDPEIINDQSIQISQTSEIDFGDSKETSPGSYRDEEEQDQARKIEYSDALLAYFSAKKKYETNWQVNKKKVWTGNIKKIGKKSTQKLVQAVVPKCINCDQPGGMSFRSEDQKYHAQCAAANPCNFHIELFRAGKYSHLLDFMDDIKELMEDDKQDHIKIKHDIEYGYLNEVEGIKREKEWKEEFELSEKVYQSTQKQWKALYSEERHEKIRRKQREIYETIAENDALLTFADNASDAAVSGNKPHSIRVGEDEDDLEEERNHMLEGRIEMVVENELKSLFPAIQTLRPWIYDNMQHVKEYREKYLLPISEKEVRVRLFQEKIDLDKIYVSESAEPPVVLRFSSVP